jgi:hypothetical protein
MKYWKSSCVSGQAESCVPSFASSKSAQAVAVIGHQPYTSLWYVRVRQKYVTILQNSCVWNRWRGEFVLERSSSETSKHLICHGTLICRSSGFYRGDVFQKQRFCLDSEDISSALQYLAERVSLVAILLPLRISQEQGARKETGGNGGFETEHQVRSGSNFSPTCCNEWYRTSRNAWGGMFWQQGTPPHRHYIQEVNIVIKMLWVKDNFSNKYA